MICGRFWGALIAAASSVLAVLALIQRGDLIILRGGDQRPPQSSLLADMAVTQAMPEQPRCLYGVTPPG